MISVTNGIHIARIDVHNVDDVIGYLCSSVQLVSVDCWRAVALAAVLAERAIKRGTAHAKTLGGELLLRLAGTHQIKEAIKMVGAKNGPNYLVVFGERSKAEEILKSIGLKELELRDCSDNELKRFFEKSALVEVL
ncbi:KEOPS complex subunit Cgi121 [Thermococcus stetteri]|uniref:KEOPS complex subunit Cgi121 n=1 Tax=Thermococcus stetteri TaxID=49900 RepID=UPI001AE93DD9|nr:KEOPS complex subunit Cgi121 [Thermococcus stetteri]